VEWSARRTSLELHVLPSPAGGPAAAIHAQVTEPNLLCVLVHRMTPRCRSPWPRRSLGPSPAERSQRIVRVLGLSMCLAPDRAVTSHAGVS
jgi:hypothetical protein